MPSCLRILALFALLVPALLVPRGFVLSLCLCGYGLEANVCTARVAEVGEALDCGCCSTTDPCAVPEGHESEGHPAGHPRSGVQHSPDCPHCHTLAIEEASFDYVPSATPTAPVLLPSVSAEPFVMVLPRGSVRTVHAEGRGPPPDCASPGLWPRVLPLRI